MTFVSIGLVQSIDINFSQYQNLGRCMMLSTFLKWKSKNLPNLCWRQACPAQSQVLSEFPSILEVKYARILKNPISVL